MADFDFTDMYIRFPGGDKYNDISIIEDEIIYVIVQKVYMILYTMKGELLGEPDFGADLYTLLHETKVSSQYVYEQITQQILKYIPELNDIGYTLDVTFSENPYYYSDIMFIDIKIKEYEVNAYFA